MYLHRFLTLRISEPTRRAKRNAPSRLSPAGVQFGVLHSSALPLQGQPPPGPCKVGYPLTDSQPASVHSRPRCASPPERSPRRAEGVLLRSSSPAQQSSDLVRLHGNSRVPDSIAAPPMC